jgi:hypothetical protein
MMEIKGKFFVRIMTVGVMILLIAGIPACSKKKQKEKEPNNSFFEANPISVDAGVLGFMNSPEDRDFFVLDVKNSAIMDIQVSGVKGINLAVKIWKGVDEPKLIKWIDDNRKSSPERFPNLAVSPGRYFIELFQSDRDSKKADQRNAYELSIKSREAISEESEPNDSMDEPDKIYPGKEKTGYFSPSYNRMNAGKDNTYREEDWYVFDVDLRSGSPILIDVTLSGVSGVNSLLYLYDSDGAEIAMSDNGSTGEGESITGAGIKKSGSYYHGGVKRLFIQQR